MLPKMEPAMLSLVTLDALALADDPVAVVASARPPVAAEDDDEEEGASVAASAAGAEDAHDGSSSPSMVIGWFEWQNNGRSKKS